MSKRKINVFKSVTNDTKDLLSGQEGREVDFKVDPKAVEAEDFVAFANASGGTILLGVDEVTSKTGTQQGLIVGCKVDDKTRMALVSKAANCRPSIDIFIQVENIRAGKPILRIDIPEGIDKPYSTSSGIYKIRIEGRNVGIDPRLIRAMILDIESNEFVARFKHAAEEILSQLNKVREDLFLEIERVQKVAELANESAIRAQGAAEEAISAALEAASAAEDAASAAMDY